MPIQVVSIERYFWLAGIIFTVINANMWWSSVQRFVRKDPSLEAGYRRLYWGFILSLSTPWLVMGLGLVLGQVAGMFEFVRPLDGNLFVFMWWLVIIGLVAIATFWICLGGGAEMLESHPGVYVVPWTDMIAKEKNGWFSRSVEFEFTKVSNLTMRLDRKLAENLISESGHSITIQSSPN